MIDLHNHLLPGIDDGAKEKNTTIKMLQIASEDGIKKIIATPHFYKGYYENNYEDVSKLVDEVNRLAKEENIDVTIFPGQEVFLDKDTVELYKMGIIKGLADSKYMLIELPMNNIPKNALDTIYELKIQGVIPVIAHPERYNYIIEKPSKINDFIAEGCLFQINSGSITGVFGSKIRKTSELLIRHGICNFIASDAHSIGSRSPRIEGAIEIVKELDSELADKIITNSENLLNNHKIQSNAEKIKEKKGLFSIFSR